ncbi:MAG: phosphoserine phosphatase SerB [Proteobacteria bacterium]|nr:phosphoserine phosphatase SerB [Pseudomonadota bacterium]
MTTSTDPGSKPLDTSSPLLRLVCAWPPPRELADYAPFRALSDAAYGMVELSGSSHDGYQAVAKACQASFLRRQTVGYSQLEQVKAVFFDMDATVIREESIVVLARYAGVEAHVAAVTERAMAGELDFRQALAERVALLKGLSTKVLAQAEAGLTLMPGILEFVAFCRRLGVPTFLVSGGFVQLAAGIAAKVGFTAYHACTLGVQDGTLTGTVVGEVVDAEAKLRYVQETCARLQLDVKSVACVGDGANDRLMLAAAGVAVGHQAKEVLYPVIQALNIGGDHRFLAPLLFGRPCTQVR